MPDAPKPLPSALAALTPSLRLPPAPDGRVTQVDRQQLAGTYAGVLAAGAVPVPVVLPRPRSFIFRPTRIGPVRVDITFPAKDDGFDVVVRAFEVK